MGYTSNLPVTPIPFRAWLYYFSVASVILSIRHWDRSVTSHCSIPYGTVSQISLNTVCFVSLSVVEANSSFVSRLTKLNNRKKLMLKFVHLVNIRTTRWRIHVSHTSVISMYLLKIMRLRLIIAKQKTVYLTTMKHSSSVNFTFLKFSCICGLLHCIRDDAERYYW